MRKQILLSSKGLTCKIEGHQSKMDEILRDSFTFHYIPDVAIPDFDHPGNVSLLEDDSLSSPVELKYPHARFRGDISARDIVTVGEYLLERGRQEKKGYHTLSSACASLDQKAVVFFGGATNLGKTTSMLGLVQRQGFEFFSDEKTLVDLEGKKIVGGSRSVAVRKSVLKDRTKVEGEFCNIEAASGNKEAYLFMYPHLDHGLEKPISYQFSNLDFYWLLLREISQEIRGTTRLVDEFSYMLPPLDTEELAKRRVSLARQFTSEVPCFYFQGSESQIVDFVRNFYENDRRKL